MFVNVVFYPLLPDFRKSIVLWKVTKLRLSDVEYGGSVEWYGQEKTVVHEEKNGRCVTLFTTDPTWAGLGSTPGARKTLQPEAF